MRDYRRFQSGSGLYSCRSCGKKTRDTGQGEGLIGLCAVCNEEAGLENEHNDTGHDHFVKGCPLCKKECIITHKMVCPHEEINGKLCSLCHIPDKEKING